MPRVRAKRVVSDGAERILQEMKAGARLVTRHAPLDNLGPHVLLRDGIPLKAASEPHIRELLDAKRIVITEPCEAEYIRCYALIPPSTVQATFAVKGNEHPPSRTANLKPPKKPRGEM